MTLSQDTPTTSTCNDDIPQDEDETHISEDTIPMASLAERGTIVAVRPNIESVYDYFLFKVESEGLKKT